MWISLTVDDLKPRFVAREFDALRQKALADGQEDPIPALIAEAIDLVRGYIAANTKNALGVGDTIPEKLKNSTLNIIRYEALNRIGMNVSDDRTQAYKDAIRLCEQVAADKFSIEDPEEETTEESSGIPTPLCTSRPRTLGRGYEDGV